MTDKSAPLESTAPSHSDRLFPTLTDAQVARIAARGRRRPIARGDVLVEIGDRTAGFFVVLSGEIEVSDSAGTLIVTHRAGSVFRRGDDDHRPPGDGAPARGRAGEVIELSASSCWRWCRPTPS